jgi:hypothetical protein
VIKAGNLIKGGNADRGFFNESNFYFSMEHELPAINRRKIGDTPQPLDVCCKHETERMQIVLRTLYTTLSSLEQAMDGCGSLFRGLYPKKF